MTALTVTRNYNSAVIRGVFARTGFAAALVAMWADPVMRGLLDEAAREQSPAAEDAAFDALVAALGERTVEVSQDDAIALRELLIKARFGAGQADTAMYGRISR